MPENTTRATFTIDKDLWKDANEKLELLGYPNRTMAVFLSHQVERLLLQLEHSDETFLDRLM